MHRMHFFVLYSVYVIVFSLGDNLWDEVDQLKQTNATYDYLDILASSNQFNDEDKEKIHKYKNFMNKIAKFYAYPWIYHRFATHYSKIATTNSQYISNHEARLEVLNIENENNLNSDEYDSNEIGNNNIIPIVDRYSLGFASYLSTIVSDKTLSNIFYEHYSNFVRADAFYNPGVIRNYRNYINQSYQAIDLYINILTTVYDLIDIVLNPEYLLKSSDGMPIKYNYDRAYIAMSKSHTVRQKLSIMKWVDAKDLLDYIYDMLKDKLAYRSQDLNIADHNLNDINDNIEDNIIFLNTVHENTFVYDFYGCQCKFSAAKFLSFIIENRMVILSELRIVINNLLLALNDWSNNILASTSNKLPNLLAIKYGDIVLLNSKSQLIKLLINGYENISFDLSFKDIQGFSSDLHKLSIIQNDLEKKLDYLFNSLNDTLYNNYYSMKHKDDFTKANDGEIGKNFRPSVLKRKQAKIEKARLKSIMQTILKSYSERPDNILSTAKLDIAFNPVIKLYIKKLPYLEEDEFDVKIIADETNFEQTNDKLNIKFKRQFGFDHNNKLNQKYKLYSDETISILKKSLLSIYYNSAPEFIQNTMTHGMDVNMFFKFGVVCYYDSEVNRPRMIENLYIAIPGIDLLNITSSVDPLPHELHWIPIIKTHDSWTIGDSVELKQYMSSNVNLLEEYIYADAQKNGIYMPEKSRLFNAFTNGVCNANGLHDFAARFISTKVKTSKGYQYMPPKYNITFANEKHHKAMQINLMGTCLNLIPVNSTITISGILHNVSNKASAKSTKIKEFLGNIDMDNNNRSPTILLLNSSYSVIDAPEIVRKTIVDVNYKLTPNYNSSLFSHTDLSKQIQQIFGGYGDYIDKNIKNNTNQFDEKHINNYGLNNTDNEIIDINSFSKNDILEPKGVLLITDNDQNEFERIEKHITKHLSSNNETKEKNNVEHARNNMSSTATVNKHSHKVDEKKTNIKKRAHRDKLRVNTTSVSIKPNYKELDNSKYKKNTQKMGILFADNDDDDDVVTKLPHELAKNKSIFDIIDDKQEDEDNIVHTANKKKRKLDGIDETQKLPNYMNPNLLKSILNTFQEEYGYNPKQLSIAPDYSMKIRGSQKPVSYYTVCSPYIVIYRNNEFELNDFSMLVPIDTTNENEGVTNKTKDKNNLTLYIHFTKYIP